MLCATPGESWDITCMACQYTNDSNRPVVYLQGMCGTLSQITYSTIDPVDYCSHQSWNQSMPSKSTFDTTNKTVFLEHNLSQSHRDFKVWQETWLIFINMSWETYKCIDIWRIVKTLMMTKELLNIFFKDICRNKKKI